MKATLEFSLPDETHEFRQALRSGQWEAIVRALSEELRNIHKYGSDHLRPQNVSQEAYEACADAFRSHLLELVNGIGGFTQ
jgi:hypothetical protein